MGETEVVKRLQLSDKGGPYTVLPVGQVLWEAIESIIGSEKKSMHLNSRENQRRQQNPRVKKPGLYMVDNLGQLH